MLPVNVADPSTASASSAIPSRRRRRLLLLVLAALAVVASVGPWMATGMTLREREGRPAVDRVTIDTLARAPTGVRVRVQVTNASGVRGLARQATTHLRARGFDVVGMDTERGASVRVTEVAVHAGPSDHGHRVRRALGVGGVVVRPDSTRYVEVRVRLGLDWQPPPQALRP